MKKSILKIVYTVIMFLIAMLMIDHFMNKGNTDITAEMPKATYPLVYVMEGDTRINCLHGYDQEIAASWTIRYRRCKRMIVRSPCRSTCMRTAFPHLPMR